MFFCDMSVVVEREGEWKGAVGVQDTIAPVGHMRHRLEITCSPGRHATLFSFQLTKSHSLSLVTR